MIELLDFDEGEDPVDVANNAAEIKIPMVSICQALSAWIAKWTVSSERLQTQLGLAFRSPSGQKLMPSSDEQTVVTFLRTLAAHGEEYTNIAEELCLMLTVQAVNDVVQGVWQKGRASAQALAYTLATVARELHLGTRPVFTFVTEMLTRCTVSSSSRSKFFLC